MGLRRSFPDQRAKAQPSLLLERLPESSLPPRVEGEVFEAFRPSEGRKSSAALGLEPGVPKVAQLAGFVAGKIVNTMGWNELTTTNGRIPGQLAAS
jgi:hypothetical protein